MRDATHEVAALRREQRKEALRATGTDDARAHTTNVRLVHTGFEVAASRATTAPPRRDRGSSDLADTAAALSYGHERSEPEATRPRATLEMIAPINLRNGDPAKDDGSETVSTDAEKTPKPDLLGLVAGARHERTERSE